MAQSKYRRSLQVLISTLIWGSLTAMWGLVWYENYAEIIQLPFYRRGNWAVIAIYAVILYMVTSFYGGYRVSDARRGNLIFSGVLSLFISNAITYMQISLINRDWMNPAPILWMTLAGGVLIWIWSSAAIRLYRFLNPPRIILFVYGNSNSAKRLISKMSKRDDKYIIREAVSTACGISEALERMAEYKAVLLCDVKSTHRNIILKYCYEKDIRVYMTPKISDIIVRGSREVRIFDTPILLSRNEGISFEQQIMKRTMDIALSAAGLVIASPFMLIIAAAVKLWDRGPAFYRQTRLTIDGRTFELIKFRSMVVDAEKESGARLASGSDDRITPVGRIIRRLRLDELPQLLNILKGDMSIVGPRPERPEIAAEYKKRMPEFDFRLKVRAGLTGLAQVHGKYNTTPYDKLKLDLMYITTCSIPQDIQLILQTVKILFVKESTEGVEEIDSV